MNPEAQIPTTASAEMLSALFAQLVMQQTNMALMLMGRMANPTTGEVMHDPEAARFFIDQLEMIEVKTRGNLNKEEEKLIKQSLMSLRMAFVESVNQTPAAVPPAEQLAKVAAPENPAAAVDDPTAAKKFSKKY